MGHVVEELGGERLKQALGLDLEMTSSFQADPCPPSSDGLLSPSALRTGTGETSVFPLHGIYDTFTFQGTGMFDTLKQNTAGILLYQSILQFYNKI